MRGGILAQYRREPEVVRLGIEEMIALSEGYGFSSLARGQVHHGWAPTELEQLEQRIAEIEAAIAGFRRRPAHQMQHAIALLAQGYAKMGRSEEAIGMVSEALAHVDRTGEKVDQAEMLRLKGEVLLMRDGGATSEAESCFRAALEVGRAQEAKWWELRATTSLGRLLVSLGRRDEARAMLAEIYNWFTEGFDTADIKDAKALLDEVAA